VFSFKVVRTKNLDQALYDMEQKIKDEKHVKNGMFRGTTASGEFSGIFKEGLARVNVAGNYQVQGNEITINITSSHFPSTQKKIEETIREYFK
jgi:hypothetical protein